MPPTDTRSGGYPMKKPFTKAEKEGFKRIADMVRQRREQATRPIKSREVIRARKRRKYDDHKY